MFSGSLTPEGWLPITGTVAQFGPEYSFGNRSALGALNQAVITSVIQTGVLNGVEPLDICQALSLKPLTSFSELPRIRSP